MSSDVGTCETDDVNPIALTEHLRLMRISLGAILENLMPSKKVQSSHLSDQPGQEWSRLIVFASCLTGLSSSFQFLSWGTVLSLISYFWSPKSMDTVSVRWRQGLPLLITLAPCQNTTSHALIDLVFLSYFPVQVYLQLCMAKNRAPHTNQERAFSLSYVAISNWFLKTKGGMAFSCFLERNSFLQPFGCYFMWLWVLPLVFRMGLHR